MQKNSGCMCKSMYIGQNVQEDGGPMKGIKKKRKKERKKDSPKIDSDLGQ